MKAITGKVEDGKIDIFGNSSYMSVSMFYNMLIDYALYWQNNTPTAYGNPDYSYLRGLVIGYAAAKNWDIRENKEKIIVKNSSGRKLIELVILPLPDSYFEAIKENKEIFDNL